MIMEIVARQRHFCCIQLLADSAFLCQQAVQENRDDLQFSAHCE